MRELLETSVPVARFEVERALDAAALETPEGRDDALRAVAPIVARLDPGPLQYDLIQLVASRLQMSESMTEEALRRAPRANGRRRAGARRRGCRRASTGARTPSALFLARCLAIKDAGRRTLDELDIDATFSTELTRRAAHYLAEHLDHPGQALPGGRRRPRATWSRELVIEAGDLAADAEALADRAAAARPEPPRPRDRRGAAGGRAGRGAAPARRVTTRSARPAVAACADAAPVIGRGRRARTRPRARPPRGRSTPTKRNSESSVPAVSKSTVPTRSSRSNSDCSVLTFCTRSTRVSCVFLARIPRRMWSRSVVIT